jgi:hypothetical protein
MNVKERDIPCLFVGTRSPNHVKREQVLRELGDLVTIAPPTFGREMFTLLHRARVVLNVHAGWARGAANNMRMFESAGAGCALVTDGAFPDSVTPFGWGRPDMTAAQFRTEIMAAMDDTDAAMEDQATVLQRHTYVQRLPLLLDLVRSI